MSNIINYQQKFEHFSILMDVVKKRLNISEKVVPIYEYREPFEFFSRSSDGSKELCLSATDILRSCNSVDSDDDLFRDELDLMNELDICLGDSVLDIVVDILKDDFDCIMIHNKE